MPKYKLAASNIAWGPESQDRVLSRMSELGFEGIEIAPTKIVPNHPYVHITEAQDALDRIHDEHGLSICSMQSIWYGRDESLFQAAERERLLEYTEKAMEYAHAIGCVNLVFGCPRNRNVPDGKQEADADGFFEACSAMAEKNGVIFALEANPRIYGTNFLNSTADVDAYLNRLAYPVGLGINLDLGAIIENGEGVEVIEQCLSHVSHIHISEPGLKPVQVRPEHRVLRDILEKEGYEGYVSLEMGQCDDDEVLLDSLQYLAEAFA